MALRSRFARRLLSWYDRDHRDLPWRGQNDPYRIWISEAMLQQTVVATVIPYYHRFLKAFPDVEALARAADDEVMSAWAGLGYYSRARSLKRAAEALVERFGGRLPADEATLRTLPGVGPYTAAAVAAIAFGQRAFALDGNAARVMARVMGHQGFIEAPETRKALHAFGLNLVPSDRAGDFAQAVMELGALVCVPRAPRCEACPVAAFCVARKTDQAAGLPRRKPRKDKKPVLLMCLAVERAGRVLLQRRPSPGLLGGTWALPSAECERPEEALAIAQTLARASALRLLRPRLLPGQVRHVFTHLDVHAVVVRAQVRAVPVENPGRWVPPNGPFDVALASFTKKLLAHLHDHETVSAPPV